jgi:hypothetical protein
MLRFNTTMFKVTILLAFLAVSALVVTTAGAKPEQAQPFKIGMITGINVLQNNAPEFIAGGQAAAAAINKKGGLGGRPIQIDVCNMQNSSAGEAACARQMVDDKVDDVVEYNAQMATSLPITDAAGIPHIASQSFNPDDFYSKSVFPVTSPNKCMYVAALSYLLKDKANKRFMGLGQAGSLASNQTIGITTGMVRREGRTWLRPTPVSLTFRTCRGWRGKLSSARRCRRTRRRTSRGSRRGWPICMRRVSTTIRPTSASRAPPAGSRSGR